MSRFKCRFIDKKEINPLSALFNVAAVCFMVGAMFNDWLLLKDSAKVEDYAVSNCTSIGSRMFLLPAQFGHSDNGTNHVFYYYDNLVYVDCINMEIANIFYLITAFSFVITIVSTFAALLQATSPPIPFFEYLRLISAFELITCLITVLILVLVKIAKMRVEDLQIYTGESRNVIFGLSTYMVITSAFFALNSAIVSQARQRKIRMDRQEENKRLMLTRPLRSRRDVPQNDFNPQPVGELERYLLEPGLRRENSSGTVSTEYIED